jgi:polysaccharide chain length determinant protein (PEP-CTERM system associated)
MSDEMFQSNQIVSEKLAKGAGLERILSVAKRRKWLALVTFTAPLAIGLTAVTAMPNIYRATATVLVDRQQVPEVFVASTVTSALETRLQTISQETLSRSRLEALINQFNLYPELRRRLFPEDVVDRMRRDIALELKGVDVRGQRQATVAFTIGYTGLVPETVAQITNTLASFYIEENQKVRVRQAAGTAEFLRVQLQDTKDRLDTQERRVSEFKRRYLGELPQQMDANLSTLERLHMQLRLNADSQARLEERRASAAAQLAEASAVAGPGTPESGVARLDRLRQTLGELRSRYTARYPDVVETQTEIETLVRQLAEAKAKGQAEVDTSMPASPQVLRLKEALSVVEAEIKGLKSEEKHLKGLITSYQQRVEQMPRREQEFTELARDYETTREFYQTLRKKYEEASIAENMEQRQQGELFRIIEPALPPRRPVTNPLRLILMTIVASAALAIGAVFAAEQLDTSFHTSDELRAHTAAPVLVTIPQIVTDADMRPNALRFGLAATAVTVGIFGLAVAAYFVAHDNEQLVRLLSRGAA